MRSRLVPLVALVVLAASLGVPSMGRSAQQSPPAAPPSAPPLAAAPQLNLNDPLDAVLMEWEKALSGVDSLVALVSQTVIDRVNQHSEVFEGQAKFLKSNQKDLASRAHIKMTLKSRPEVFQEYMCTGNFVYEWVPKDKIIRRHPVPQRKDGQIADDTLLGFLLGMKAAQAKQRYKLTYVPAPPDQAKWYHFIKVEPTLIGDKAEFQEARLTLWTKSYLPRQIFFREPNGNEIRWDFAKIVTPADLRATDFATPTLPPGWRIDPVAADTPARIIRPNQ